MKIRTDFVTNSSSSSFVIGYTDTKEYSTLISAAMRIADRSYDKIVRTKEELLKALDIENESELEKESSYVNNIFTRSMEQIDKGQPVAFVTVDWENEGIARLFDEIAESDENFKILECD